jgi:hypothetical protein
MNLRDSGNFVPRIVPMLQESRKAGKQKISLPSTLHGKSLARVIASMHFINYVTGEKLV